jgi:Eukaryotic aspartyl protease
MIIVTPDDSSTFKDVEKGGFNISYVDGTGSVGDYFTDDFTISDTTLESLQMGLALSTSLGRGIMGIGYSSGEASVFSGDGKSYPSVIEQMVSQKFINTKAYSLYLDDLRRCTVVE